MVLSVTGDHQKTLRMVATSRHVLRVTLCARGVVGRGRRGGQCPPTFLRLKHRAVSTDVDAQCAGASSHVNHEAWNERVKG